MGDLEGFPTIFGNILNSFMSIGHDENHQTNIPRILQKPFPMVETGPAPQCDAEDGRFAHDARLLIRESPSNGGLGSGNLPQIARKTFRFTRWWQLKDFLFSARQLRKWSKFDEHMIQTGWNHQLEMFLSFCKDDVSDDWSGDFCWSWMRKLKPVTGEWMDFLWCNLAWILVT